MRHPPPKDIKKALLSLYGTTYAQELGIDLARNSPAALFQMLCATLLFSVRISEHIAVQGARELFRRGWTTPQNMLRSTWQQRVQALDAAKYVRYDESRSTMLEDMCRLLLDRYGGDLRNLREAAGRTPAKERALLEEFKGIGPVGATIFFREAQVAWDELYPFADDRAREAARRLGLDDDPKALANLAGKKDFPRLVAALIRTWLKDAEREVLEKAREGRMAAAR